MTDVLRQGAAQAVEAQVADFLAAYAGLTTEDDRVSRRCRESLRSFPCPRSRAKYQAKYDKAADCLAKDREALFAFHDVPAEHWQHVRSTNPIESTFATVRLRTNKTKGCLSRDTALAMVFMFGRPLMSPW